MSLIMLSWIFIAMLSILQLSAASRLETLAAPNPSDAAARLARLRREMSDVTWHLDVQDVQADQSHDASLWRSYRFSHDSASRDALFVKEIRRASTFAGVNFDVKQWISDAEMHQIALGLTPSALVICRFNGTIADASCGETATPEKPLTAVLYSTRHSGVLEIYVVAALDKNHQKASLQWYHVHEELLKPVGVSWILLRIPMQLIPFRASGQLKLLVLNKDVSEIYDISNYTELWLTQKLNLKEAEKAAIHYSDDTVYLSISQNKKEVNIYEYKGIRFELLTQILSKDVTDICAFRTGFTSYLALTGTEPRIVRIPPSVKDLQKNIFHSSNVKRWLAIPVPTYRDDVMLFAETDEGGIHVVTWNAPGQFTWMEADEIKCVDELDGSISHHLTCLKTQGLKGAAGIVVNKHPVLLFPVKIQDVRSYEQYFAPTLFSVTIRLELLPSPAQIEQDHITAKRKAIEKLLQSQVAIINEAKRKLKYILKPDAVITAPWVVKYITAPSVQISGQYESQKEHFAGVPWTSDDWHYLKSIKPKLIEIQKQRVNELHLSVQDAVSINDDGDLKISSHQEIEGAINVKGKTTIESADFMSINNFSIYEIFENTVQLENPKTVGGHKSFASLFVEELYVTDTLNGAQVQQFASKAKPISIHGNVNFTQPLTITGDLKAVDFSKSFLQTSPNAADNTHKINTLSIENLDVDGFINNLPVSHFTKRLAEKSQNLNISGTLNISGNVQAKYINGVKMSDFLELLVPLNSSQPIYIPGDTFIQSCKMKNVTVTSLNELSFPDDYVLRGDIAEISGFKFFDNELVVDRLNVTNSLDSVPVDDLIFLDTNLHLSGQWTMGNVTVFGDLHVNNKLEPNITESWDENAALFNAANLEFKHLEVLGDIRVDDPEFLDGFVYQNDQQIQKIVAQKHFKKSVTANKITINGLVNDIEIKDFITVDTDQIITGKKIFTGQVLFDNLDVDGTVLSINLTALSENAVRLSTNQTLPSSNFVFADVPVIENGLYIKALSGFDEENIITLDAAQTINGSVTFNKLEVHDLTVKGNIETSQLVNNKNLRHIDEQRVSQSRDQNITGAWTIDHAHVHGMLDVDTINEASIDNFKSRIIVSNLKDSDLTKFHEISVVGHIKTKSINDFDINRIANDAIWTNRKNIIVGNLTIQGSLITNELSVRKIWNNISLEHLLEDIVTKDQDNVHFTGSKTIINGAHIKNIDCLFVNGRNMKDVLTKSSDQAIYGPKIFNGTVEIDGEINALYLNGFPLSDLHNLYSYQAGHHVINDNVTFSGAVTTENLDVSQTVQGYDVNKIFSEVVWKTGNAVVLSKKTFSSPVVMQKNFAIERTFNGMDMNKFMENVVLIDRPSKVKGPIIFHDDVFANNGIIVDEDLNLDTIQNCSLFDWVTHAIYLDVTAPVLGSKIFENITSSGPMKIREINEIDMNRVILLNAKRQFIPEVLTFQSISSNSSIPVGGLVNDWKLKEEYKNTLLTEGVQDIIAPKTFIGEINILRDIVPHGLINGYKVEDIVTLNTDQKIYGNKVFHDVEVMSGMTVIGPINGQDLDAWSKRVVRTNLSDVEITGTWDVKGNITFLGFLHGPVLDGIHLSNFLDQQELRQENSARSVEEILRDKNKFCKNVEDLLNRAREQTYTFQYLEGIQFFHTAHPVLSSVHIKIGNTDLLAVSLAGLCEGTVLQWDTVNEKFVPSLTIAIGGVNTWAALPPTKSGEVYLISAGSLPECHYTGGNLWVARRGKPFKFQHVEILGNWTSVEQSVLDPYTIYSLYANETLSEWKYNETTGLYLVRTLGTVAADFLKDPFKMHSLLDVKILKSKPSLASDENVRLGNRSHLVVTTHKQQARVYGNHHDIKIYKGLPEGGELFHRLPVTDPGSVISIQFPYEKYIVFVEDNAWLQLYRYEGVAGFQKIASAHIPGVRLLQVIRLPAPDSLSLRTVLLLSIPSPRPGLYLMEMCMLGDPAPHVSLPDDCYAN